MTDDRTPADGSATGAGFSAASQPPPAGKKATKKVAPRKASANKPAPSAGAAAKASTKKATAQKPVAKKPVAKKAVAKKAVAKKATGAKKPVGANKTAAKRAPARKAAPKQAAPAAPEADARQEPAAPLPPAVAPAVTDAGPAETAEPPGTTAGAVRARSRAEEPAPPAARRPSAEAVARRVAAQAEAGAAPAVTGNDATLDITEAPPAEAPPVAPAPEPAPPEPPRAEGLIDPATAPRPWLASYPPGVPETYPYPEVALTRFLDDAAKDFPDTIAVEFLGRTMTYRKLLDDVDRFASALRDLGVEKGDRVGLVLPNCPQHVIAIFAVLRLGAIVAENNPLYTESELEHQINDAGCKVLVVLDPVYQKIAALKGRLQTVRHVIGTGLQDYLPAVKQALYPVKFRKDPAAYYKIPASEGVLRFVDLIAQSQPTVAQVPVDARRDVAMLVYTGGTTGVSKGVMLTHHNLVSNAFQGRLWVPDVQAGRENILCVVPFFHSYGLTVCLMFGMLSAATLTLLPRFDRDMVLKSIDKQKPTLFPGIPTIYVALNNAPNVRKFDLSSIRACLSGAAPLPVEVARTFEELTGGKLREGYGLTETSPITHANPIYGKAKHGCIGLPISDTVCTLVDADDPTLAARPGEPGELAISGPQVMAGYWKRPDETDQVLRDGWFLTGDIAQMDDEGYFAIVDRKKDMIIAGGYNIYPRDIEEVLYTHPKIAKAVVAGVPDSYRGETVKAYIVLKEGERATTEEIDQFSREKLAAYKVPKAYEFRDELPETMVGKVLRRKLVEEEQARLDQR